MASVLRYDDCVANEACLHLGTQTPGVKSNEKSFEYY